MKRNAFQIILAIIIVITTSQMSYSWTLRKMPISIGYSIENVHLRSTYRGDINCNPDRPDECNEINQYQIWFDVKNTGYSISPQYLLITATVTYRMAKYNNSSVYYDDPVTFTRIIRAPQSSTQVQFMHEFETRRETNNGLYKSTCKAVTIEVDNLYNQSANYDIWECGTNYCGYSGYIDGDCYNY